jgi:hypothetical protein
MGVRSGSGARRPRESRAVSFCNGSGDLRDLPVAGLNHAREEVAGILGIDVRVLH